MRIPKLLSMLLALMVVSGELVATPEEEFEKGSKAFKKGDMITAMPMLESASNAGHVEAMLMLGFIYDNAEENETALGLYKRAAELGSAKGQFKYGLLLLKGEGTKKNSEEGIRWINKAVEQKHTPAMIFIAGSYLYGTNSLKEDTDRGMTILNQAISLGSKDAEAYLERYNKSMKMLGGGK